MTRKSLYDISWKVTEEEYRQDKAYSYSTIAKFDREGFDKLSSLFDRVETPSLTFGSMVDTLITDSQEAFDNLYTTADFPALSDTQEIIVKSLFKSYGEDYLSLEDIPDKMVSDVCIMYNYYANERYNNLRASKIKKDCSEYYDLLVLTKSKTLVDRDTYNDAINCAYTLKTSEYTKFYFENDNPFDNSVERLYQLKFKGEYNGIPLRCMMDEVIVLHDKKIIIPIDLKTSSKKEWNFHKSFIEWKYYVQSQLYWTILRQNLDKDEYFKDFTLLDYRFIVICRSSNKPLVWTYKDTQSTEPILYYGKDKQYKCRNWRTIVTELHHYMTHITPYPIGITDLNDITEWLNKD